MMKNIRVWLTLPFWLARFALGEIKQMKFWQYVLWRALIVLLAPLWLPLLLLCCAVLAPIGWTIEWYEDVKRDYNYRKGQ